MVPDELVGRYHCSSAHRYRRLPFEKASSLHDFQGPLLRVSYRLYLNPTMLPCEVYLIALIVSKHIPSHTLLPLIKLSGERFEEARSPLCVFQRTCIDYQSSCPLRKPGPLCSLNAHVVTVGLIIDYGCQ